MDQVEVEITGLAITARYGTLKTGDILRTDKEYADHLVNDCGVAKYVVAKVVKPKAAPAPLAGKTKRKPASMKVAAAPSAVLLSDTGDHAPGPAGALDTGAARTGADVCTDPPKGGAGETPP